MAICEKHGEYVEIERVFFGKKIVTPCPMCDKEMEEQEEMNRQREEKKLAQQKKLEWYKARNIEPEYYGATFENYIAESESQKQALQAVKELVNGDLQKIILLGGNGIGKTHLGNVAVMKLGGKIMTAYEVSLYIRDGMTQGKEWERLEELSSLPLLVIDEWGRIKASEAERNWHSYIFDKRHVRGLKTMIMGNPHFYRECKNGGCERCFERLIDSDSVSRFVQNGITLTVTGRDYRRK